MRYRLALLVTAWMAASAFAQAPPATPRFDVVQRATLGGEGFWDYVTYDPALHRLFIARSNRVMVADSESLKQMGEVPNTAGVHGVAIVPEVKRAFATLGAENAVLAFDPASLKELKRISTGERPDFILYDSASKRVFTFNARGADTTAIDPTTMAGVGSLPLGGKPEAAAADGEGNVYVNIEDKAEVAEFDARNLRELARWPLAQCEEPTGLAIDVPHRRLFSGCANKLMAISDTAARKVIATVPIGEGVDGVSFDPGLQLAFASNGHSGTVTVVREESPSRFSVVQTIETAAGARTHTLDPDSHRLYLITAGITEAGGKRAVAPNSFQVLVLAPKP